MVEALDLPHVHYQPATLERWNELELLFGPRGACAGCWCTYWRQNRKDFEAGKGEGNRFLLHSLMSDGSIPGILAFSGDKAIGWCSIAPRTEFPVLARSRVLQPVDDRPVWSVVCFFVGKGFRRKGLTVGLLKAAVDFARENGAKIVEGYPVIPKTANTAAVFIYTGTHSAFLQAGFVEVARRSPTRPIMRYFLEEQPS